MTVKNTSVAVITSTIGRPELERAIISVQNQTYPCKHYVFVDGKQFWQAVEPLVEKYPEVDFIFLPMNTGGKNKIGNGGIHAAAPYLVQENILCFLDDDNWHDPNHIESLVGMIEKYDLDYTYCTRRMWNEQGNFLFDDYSISTGFILFNAEIKFDYNGKTYITKPNSIPLIDTNCYAIKRKTALLLPLAWYSGQINDRMVFQKLKEINAKGGFTAKVTTNYTFTPILNTDLSEELRPPLEVHLHTLSLLNQAVLNKIPSEFKKPLLFIDGNFSQAEDYL